MAELLNGAFNIKTNQFLGNDPMAYLNRDDERTVAVWGQLNPETGEFIATRNPVKYDEGALTAWVPENPNEARAELRGYRVDNSVDYRGSKFFDEAFMQRGKDGKISVKDAVEYAAHLSKEAKAAKLRAGDPDMVRTKFFEPEAKGE